MANLPSGSAYPHVLYAKILSCQGTSAWLTISEWKGATLNDYAYAILKFKTAAINLVCNLRRIPSSTQICGTPFSS